MVLDITPLYVNETDFHKSCLLKPGHCQEYLNGANKYSVVILVNRIKWS